MFYSRLSTGIAFPESGTVYLIMLDANTVDIFKSRLDKFWHDQEVFYDFTCDITGTGDRSER